jgi:hypothetical protein
LPLYPAGLKCMMSSYRCLVASTGGPDPPVEQLLVDLARRLADRPAQLSAAGQRVLISCVRQLLSLLLPEALLQLLPTLMGSDQSLIYLG